MEFSAISIFEYFVLIFGIVMTTTYTLMSVVSATNIYRYRRTTKSIDFKEILNSPMAPTISIIAPAFNESEVIVDCVRSMLSLHYSNYEVIVINDGSEDDTLEKLIEGYKLVKQKTVYTSYLKTQKIRGVYKSTVPSLSKLTVIDKENGGKSDASNAALNFSVNDYVVCCDVDSILEEDSLLKLIKPVLEQTEYRIIAVGGIIRIINSCEVKKGKLLRINIPNNFWARIQVLEYIRSFIFGLLFWSKINGLLLVSGALGLFDRKLVIDSGGYNEKTIGEDMELIVRMRNNLKAMPHKVLYIPEPLCWTEVPESLSQLSSQRRRWTRGMIQVITKYKHMLFNPRHKTLGLISFPYWILFEWMAPILEVLGIFLLIYLIYNNLLEPLKYLGILFNVYLFYLIYTIGGIIVEKLSFKQYLGWDKALKLIGAALLEPIIYHPLMVWYALRANITFIMGKRQAWGKMKRKGF